MTKRSWLRKLGLMAALATSVVTLAVPACTTDIATFGEGGGTPGACGQCTPAGDCREQTCVDGCSYVALEQGTACDDDGGSVCDGLGVCVGCVSEADCAEDDLCSSNKCVPASCTNNQKDLTETDVDCGGACAPCDNFNNCETAEDCVSGYCPEVLCLPCTEHGHCDGKPGTYCSDLENGGACVGDELAGTACADDAECETEWCENGYCCSVVCEGPCDTCADVPGTCTVTQQGEEASPTCDPYVCDGTAIECPTSCEDNGDCVESGFCEDATTCQSKLLVQGEGCDAGTECASGHCVDGFCCDTACEGFCEGCSAALTPLSDGACALIDNNKNETFPTTCNGIMSCDGVGGCKEDNGQPCSDAAECSSGFCIDGFCCNAACTAKCRACSSALTAFNNGACAAIDIPFTEDLIPADSCVDTLTCQGGKCLLKSGEECELNNECATNACVDGFCCESLCDGLCEACSNALTGADNGACAPILMDTDPDEECTDPDDEQCCDGSGMCGGSDPACDI